MHESVISLLELPQGGCCLVPQQRVKDQSREPSILPAMVPLEGSSPSLCHVHVGMRTDVFMCCFLWAALFQGFHVYSLTWQQACQVGPTAAVVAGPPRGSPALTCCCLLSASGLTHAAHPPHHHPGVTVILLLLLWIFSLKFTYLKFYCKDKVVLKHPGTCLSILPSWEACRTYDEHLSSV